MSKKLGDIEYTQKEYLNLGSNYPSLNIKKDIEYRPELHIIGVEEDFVVERADTRPTPTK